MFERHSNELARSTVIKTQMQKHYNKTQWLAVWWMNMMRQAKNNTSNTVITTENVKIQKEYRKLASSVWRSDD